ncbi:MAG: hypothetical protein IIX45_06330 [Lachnospiraceae bacterium]|nr:hypothetical protein [Lachnospiraceae bacterium]
MSVNGIQTNTYSSYAAESYTKTAAAKVNEAAGASKTDTSGTTTSTDTGVVYESSIEKMSEEERANLVAKLKADADNRVNQLKSLVENMFLSQGKKVKNADDIWSMLASGKFTVDPQTAEQAQSEISEDGYWGVKQTSERIFEMAQALSGGDAEKMDEMLEAFKRGFEQATKTWGGTLPDISHQTYDAVIEKFENYKAES